MPKEGPPKGENISIEAQTLQDLMKQYGGIEKIPDELLHQFGYERDQPGSIKRKDIIAQEHEREKEKVFRFKEKSEQAPFGILEVSLSREDFVARRLSAEATWQFKEKIQRIEDFEETLRSAEINDILNKLVLEGDPFIAFKNSFHNFLQRYAVPEFGDEQSQYVEEDIFVWWSTYWMADDVEKFLEQLDLNSKCVANEDEEDYIPSDKAGDMVRDLERARGIFTDLPRIQDNFSKKDELLANRSETDYTVLDYYTARHIKTTQEATRHFFALYLEAQGLGDVAGEMKSIKTSQEAMDVLSRAAQKSPAVMEKEKKLREDIKASPIEKKRVLSKELSEMLEQQKKKARLLRGMGQFFDLPRLEADYFNRTIDDLQAFLKMDKRGGHIDSDFYLDATPDPKRDANPGIVSGDCTIDRPLPFEDPDILVYNVKVYDAGKEHIGNMYLLVTESENKKVWHLDAIQIPSNIDWERSIAVVIDALAKQAETKGVEFITVNEEDIRISNYDYIREAIKKYNEKYVRGEKIYVVIPKVSNEKYSSFQGDGSALVLWRKESP